jgi:hypothetical protein
MVPLVHRSIVKKFLIVVSCIVCLCVPIPAAYAQHVTPGRAVPIPAPPVSHVRISPAPILHVPISPPRMPIVSSAGGDFGGAWFRPPRRPIRPFPPVLFVYDPFLFSGPFWGLNSCWWTSCDLFWPWLGFTTVASPGPTNYVFPVYETPVNVYGEERQDLPQLFLKDGTILNVTDYWLVDDQLHFTMIEDEGTKPAEHVIPFEALDLQRTVDVNTGRGFHFMLRNEPFEQYVRDHPEGSPQGGTSHHY